MALRKVVVERDDQGYWEEPDGEIVEVLEINRGRLNLLVREDRPDPEPEVELPFDPSEYTVSDLREELRGRVLSDEESDLLRESEEAGKNRSTAVEAIKEA